MTATELTQCIGCPTHVSVDLTRKELANKVAAIKTHYEPFPEGTRYGFSAAILLAADYRKRVTTLDAAWTFKVPDIPVTYDPIIDGRMSETNKAKKEADWEVHLEVHEVYLGVEGDMNHLILIAYDVCWLEEIEDGVLDFTHKTEK